MQTHRDSGDRDGEGETEIDGGPETQGETDRELKTD
jgi:hypothetical protein